jgi:hypothetical protein
MPAVKKYPSTHPLTHAHTFEYGYSNLRINFEKTIIPKLFNDAFSIAEVIGL